MMSDVITLWDVASRRRLRTEEGTASAAFSPDGTKIATHVGLQIVVWDVATGQELARMRGHATRTHHLSFSPDGKTLASGGQQRVLLWDVASGAIIRALDAMSCGNGTRIVPVDLSLGDADPTVLLETAQREAGLRLDGVSVTPMELS